MQDDATGKDQMKLWHIYRVEMIPTAPDLKNAFTIDGVRFPIPTGVHIAKSNHIKGIVKLVPDTAKDAAPLVTPTFFSNVS